MRGAECIAALLEPFICGVSVTSIIATNCLIWVRYPAFGGMEHALPVCPQHLPD